jgi:hypothetical protein
VASLNGSNVINDDEQQASDYWICEPGVWTCLRYRVAILCEKSNGWHGAIATSALVIAGCGLILLGAVGGRLR